MRRLDDVTVGTKIRVLVVGVIAVLLVVSMGLLNHWVRSDAVGRLDMELDSASRVAADMLEARMERLSMVCAPLAAAPRFKATIEDGDRATILDSARDEMKVVGAGLVLVTDREGRELARVSPGPLPGKSEEMLVIADARSGHPAADVWLIGGALYQVAAHPIAFDKNVTATLSIGRAIDDELAARIANLTDTSVVFLAGGRPVAASSASAPASCQSYTPKYGHSACTVEDSGQRFRVFSRDVKDRAGATVASVVVYKSVDSALAHLPRIQVSMVGAAVAVGLLALGLAVFLTRAITTPLEALMESTRQVQSGNYDEPVKASSGDEIGLLAQRFDEMRSSLKSHIAQIIEQERMRSEMEMERHRSLSEMVAGVAHEINTPLGIVNQAASMFTESLTPEVVGAPEVPEDTRLLLTDLSEAARLMQSNISRANTLIASFKNLSVRQVVDSREKLDLPSFVKEVVGLFSIKGKQSGIAVEVVDELPPDGRTWDGFPGHLTQVLMNFLQNAERYAYPNGQGGRVRIALKSPAAGSFAIEVSDFGAGIPAEVLPQIFNPFFTTGRARGGTGLGLAIVKTLVNESLKGKIDVKSAAGEGTTFTLVVPAVVPDTPA